MCMVNHALSAMYRWDLRLHAGTSECSSLTYVIMEVRLDDHNDVSSLGVYFSRTIQSSKNNGSDYYWCSELTIPAAVKV